MLEKMEKVGKSWKKLEKAGKSWEMLRKVEENWDKLRKVGKSYEKVRLGHSSVTFPDLCCRHKDIQIVLQGNS